MAGDQVVVPPLGEQVRGSVGHRRVAGDLRPMTLPAYKVYTININGLAASWFDKLRWIRMNLIQARKADIVLIQETRLLTMEEVSSRFLGYVGAGKLVGFSPAHCSEGGGRSKGLIAWVPETSKVLDLAKHCYSAADGRYSVIRVDAVSECHHISNIYAPSDSKLLKSFIKRKFIPYRTRQSGLRQAPSQAALAGSSRSP